MEFNDLFKLNRSPVPVVEFRLGKNDNVQIPGSCDGQYWELPTGVDIEQTSFIRLGQPWLDFFAKGDIFQIELVTRLPERFFDISVLRLPSGRVWVGYCHQLPDDLVLLRAGQTLVGAVIYGLDQVQVLGRVLRCFRGIPSRARRKQKHSTW